MTDVDAHIEQRRERGIEKLRFGSGSADTDNPKDHGVVTLYVAAVADGVADGHGSTTIRSSLSNTENAVSIRLRFSAVSRSQKLRKTSMHLSFMVMRV